ncbi:hypothetical protein, partial [Microbispora sp. GKU 823]|uniref:hypothetical protein n=1 Tax=Microbispora sp. GKU 823 TaxID=1652100 RepID=UPI0009C56C4A
MVNIAAIMALHRLPIPDIPGVPAALTAVLRHGMATDPAQRIGTAAGLRDALLHVDLEVPQQRGQGIRAGDLRGDGTV